jgi:hypothetical protein
MFFIHDFVYFETFETPLKFPFVLHRYDFISKCTALVQHWKMYGGWWCCGDNYGATIQQQTFII